MKWNNLVKIVRSIYEYEGFYRQFNMSTFKNSLFRATFTYISESTPNRVGSNSDYFSAIGQDIFGEVLSALCSQYLVGKGTDCV